jgi:hypothetical protein
MTLKEARRKLTELISSNSYYEYKLSVINIENVNGIYTTQDLEEGTYFKTISEDNTLSLPLIISNNEVINLHLDQPIITGYHVCIKIGSIYKGRRLPYSEAQHTSIFGNYDNINLKRMQE